MRRHRRKIGGSSRAGKIAKRPLIKTRSKRLRLAVCQMTDKYLRQGGSFGDQLEAFLTTSTTESIIKKLRGKDRAAFEDLVSACLRAYTHAVTDNDLEKAFAKMTLRDFIRSEEVYFGRTAVR